MEGHVRLMSSSLFFDVELVTCVSARRNMANGEDFSFSWSSLPAMPTKRVFAAAVGVENRLYVIGKSMHKLFQD